MKNISDLLEHLYLQKNYSHNTIIKHLKICKLLDEFIKENNLTYCNENYRKFYQYMISSKRWNIYTASESMRIIGTIIKNLISLGYLDTSYSLKNEYKAEFIPKRIKMPKIETILSFFHENSDDLGIFASQVVMASGLRVHELQQLDYSLMELFEINNKELYRFPVFNQKVKKQQIVYFLPMITEILKENITNNPCYKPFYVYDKFIYTIITEATKSFFGTKYNPTACRKIFSCLLNYFGLDILEKQKLFRHSTYTTTLNFYDGDKGLSGIEKVINKWKN